MSDGPDLHASSVMRRWGGMAAFAVAVLVAAGAALWAFSRDDSSAVGMIDRFRPEIGQEAPDFALVDARAPERVIHLSDFRGRPVILNWYASWCAPCKNEIPTFLTAQETLGVDELVILGVDLQEPAERALEILEELEATYPAMLDSDGDVYAHYLMTTRGMPVTYFIDAEGILRDAHSGEVDEERLVDALGTVGLDYEPPSDEDEEE